MVFEDVLAQGGYGDAVPGCDVDVAVGPEGLQYLVHRPWG